MTTVKTVADPRIIDEQGVVMNQYVGPANWEHYKIPASGLSNTQITFANIVTLGTNRLYDANFEIEYTLEVKLPIGSPPPAERLTAEEVIRNMRVKGFPLHHVTDQLRCNINGSACMSRPQESLDQRMMYWNQKVIDATCNYCPHDKPTLTEEPEIQFSFYEDLGDGSATMSLSEWEQKFLFNKKGTGLSIGKPLPCVSYQWDPQTYVLTITFREPVLCPPFNQRLDRIYQRPLFNVTSIDIVYQLNDLRRMFENWSLIKYTPPADISEFDRYTAMMRYTDYLGMSTEEFIVNIKSAQLCFNVASLPSGTTVPPAMTLPYYDNVNYVTSYLGTTYTDSEQLVSGVYTLAQIPTAIYIFVSEDQLFRSSGTNNKSINFCPIRDINITMGNNTQLLTTTTENERYRMCLANGLQNTSWEDFTQPCQFIEKPGLGPLINKNEWFKRGGHGCRCVLRLIPGIDLLIPERRLVGGMDADQMVFQVRLTADMSAVPDNSKGHMALWLMFEYCGVLTIEPVHANIDMIPIKSMPAIAGIDAVADATVSSEGELPPATPGSGTPEGGGIFSSIWSALKNLPSLAAKGLRAVSNFMTSPQANAARGIISSFLGQGDSSGDSNWAQQGARWLGNSIRSYGNTGPIIEEVSDSMDLVPATKAMRGGSIIGSGTLGKFYT